MNPIGPELLARLLDEHGPALVLYARQWCRSPEDAVQEAFMELVRQRVAPENLVAWLFRVVRNGAISASRAESRRHRREAAVAQSRDPWFDAANDRRLDASAAAEALAELPLDQRETIVARLWGGLTLEEVAQLTGTSAATALRRYRAGLEALRERLGAACPPNKTSHRT